MLVALLVFHPNYARFSKLCYFFQCFSSKLCSTKNRHISKKGKFYWPLILLFIIIIIIAPLTLHAALVVLSNRSLTTLGFYGSLQDLKVLGLCFGGGVRRFVTLSHLWEWDWEQDFPDSFPERLKNYSNLALEIADRLFGELTLYLKSIYHHDITISDIWAWF